MTDVIHKVKTESDSKEEYHYIPSVYLEVSKEQLGMLEVGNVVNIKLLGKVERLEARETDKNNNRYEISLELKEVKIDPEENEFTKLSEDD